jgi:hypothetical protein
LGAENDNLAADQLCELHFHVVCRRAGTRWSWLRERLAGSRSLFADPQVSESRHGAVTDGSSILIERACQA